MSIGFENIRQGDRIRATRKGVIVEGPVKSLWAGSLEIGNDYYFIVSDIEGWDFEKVREPLPTEPGLYVEQDADPAYDPTFYKLSQEGEWSCDASNSWSRVPDDQIPEHLAPLVKVVPLGLTSLN